MILTLVASQRNVSGVAVHFHKPLQNADPMLNTTESRVLVVACEELLLAMVTVLLHAPTDCERPSKRWVGQDRQHYESVVDCWHP
jgi:hypothetical protein